MTELVSGEELGAQRHPAPRTFSREAVLALGVAAEIALTVAVAVASSVGYHLAAYGATGSLHFPIAIGFLVAVLFEMPLLLRSGDRNGVDISQRRDFGQLANTWTYAFLCIGVIIFIAKLGDHLSRGWLLIYYVAGLATILAYEIMRVCSVEHAQRQGLISSRRLLLIGGAEDLDRFMSRHVSTRSDFEVASAIELDNRAGDAASLQSQLAPAADVARRLGVNDVVLLTDFSGRISAAAIAEPFCDLPVAIHLGNIGELEQFPDVGVSTIGSARTLVLRDRPLSVFQLVAKRLLDVVVSVIAIVLLTPVMTATALAIKLDSKGPVFFRQRRRGYNQEEFRIWKFRTMTTLDDGDKIVQAQRNDPRVTRIGAILRKYSIDELPQLFNVLAGTMSLVGPRPHAVAHDQHYERTISRYARRLNVKPGITGWAQIHGFRGLTSTESQMRLRLMHDLYYIENWSLALDLYIMAMTVLSPRTYKNAH